MEQNEITMESNPKSFSEELIVLEEAINKNLNTIYNYLESLKASDMNAYEAFSKEYNDVNQSFQTTDGEARRTGESSDDAVKQKFLDDLNVILNYTNMAIERFQMPMHDNIDPQSQVPNTAMVTTAEQPSNQIVMQNVGALRAFWESMEPNTKTLIKALAIGGLIFGAKYAFDRYKEGKPVPRVTNRHQDYEDEDIDDDEPEELEE